IWDKLADAQERADSNDRTRVTVVGPGGRGRTVTVNRISTDTKPAPSQVNATRDSLSGHIVLAYRDGSSKLLYEPEIRRVSDVTTSHRVKPRGRQLFRLDSDILRHYVEDQANFGMYGYLQIFGKITRVGYGYDFDDDPLNTGGFGPNDATIRV